MATKTKKKPQRPARRLSLELWLEEALEALAEHGPQVLTVEKLCKRLKVSRGSFYWHFKDRDDFIQKVVNFWDKRLTGSIRDAAKLGQGDAAERLLFLMELIDRANAGRYDIPIRAWAAANARAAKAVRRTDRTRYEYVRSLFAELGFTGDELEMRTRTFVAFHGLERGLSIVENPKDRKRRLKLRHKLLIQTE